MQVRISTRHGHLSQTTQDKLTAKLEKLKRFKERMTAVDVTVDLERSDAPKIELRVSMERSNDFVAHAEGEDMWGVLDGAIHKIEEQMRRHKAKKVDAKRGGPQAAARRSDGGAWSAAPGEEGLAGDDDLDGEPEDE